MSEIFKITKKEFDYEEINFKFLLNNFWRNRKLIILTLMSFLIFSSIYTFFIKKKMWLGRFEIVLRSNSIEQKLDPIRELPLGFALGGSDSKLETEVGILKSPSVLLPVFNFVNDEYKLKFPNNKDLVFSDWRKNNLYIALQKNTSILEIVYSDHNKKNIIPVLEKISSEYKDYSGKNKRRNIQLAKEYLIEQISLFKVKSANSLKMGQQYAIDQDLITINNPNMEGSLVRTNNNNEQIMKFSPYFMKSNTGILEIRSRAANEIRNIKNQIEKIEELTDPVNQLQFLGSTVLGLNETGLPLELQKIENKLADLRTKYTEKDKAIVRTIEERNLLVKLLKERAIGYLKASLLTQEALMESATRPKSVILKYKELMREAFRDETTLSGLENSFRDINLEESRLEDPWELINQPTLNEVPKGLSDIKYIFLMTSAGFLIGCILSFIKENKSGVLYEDELISKEFNTELIEKININTENLKYNNIDILTKEILNETEYNDLSFIFSGQINKLALQKLKVLFNQIKNFKIEENFSEINSKSKIIVFAINGEIKKQQIHQTLNRLAIQNKKIYGLILLEK